MQGRISSSCKTQSTPATTGRMISAPTRGTDCHGAQAPRNDINRTKRADVGICPFAICDVRLALKGCVAHRSRYTLRPPLTPPQAAVGLVALQILNYISVIIPIVGFADSTILHFALCILHSI